MCIQRAVECGLYGDYLLLFPIATGVFFIEEFGWAWSWVGGVNQKF